MKHRLTALAALAAIVAVPAVAFASPNLDFTVSPPPGAHLAALASAQSLIYPDIPAKVSMDDHLAVAVPASMIASAAPLIYPDIPAKVSKDDHYAVLVPLAGAVTAPHKTALVVPRDGDAAQRLASADITYLASECPAVMSHPADHTALLDRFCQTGRG